MLGKIPEGEAVDICRKKAEELLASDRNVAFRGVISVDAIHFNSEGKKTLEPENVTNDIHTAFIIEEAKDLLVAQVTVTPFGEITTPITLFPNTGIIRKRLHRITIEPSKVFPLSDTPTVAVNGKQWGRVSRIKQRAILKDVKAL